MKIGTREFQTSGHTYVMGILNVTPDSFSDGGQFQSIDAALAHTERMLIEGMDIVDIGGESTRPGFTPVSVQEEIDRVCPVIEAIHSRFDVPISLDTSKSSVAQAGILAGADLINDIWGLKGDEQLAGVIAKERKPCVLMHNRAHADYTDFISGLCSDLTETLTIAKCAGIIREQIILDPGIGFGKTYEQNLALLRQLDVLHRFDLPILLGTSRKSVIGLALGLPVEERVEGTLVTTVLAVQQGCMFVRVHDVKENVRAIRMAEAIYAEKGDNHGSDQNR